MQVPLHDVLRSQAFLQHVPNVLLAQGLSMGEILDALSASVEDKEMTVPLLPPQQVPSY